MFEVPGFEEVNWLKNLKGFIPTPLKGFQDLACVEG